MAAVPVFEVMSVIFLCSKFVQVCVFNERTGSSQLTEVNWRGVYSPAALVKQVFPNRMSLTCQGTQGFSFTTADFTTLPS